VDGLLKAGDREKIYNGTTTDPATVRAGKWLMTRMISRRKKLFSLQ